MKVEFREILIEGFGSCASKTHFHLNQGGVILIKGMNGSGKTTLFSAFCWAAYGINLKGVKNDAVQSWEKARIGGEYRGTRVLITFKRGEKHYMIARHLKFGGKTLDIVGGDKLMIFEKNEDEKFGEKHLIGSEQHKKHQQEFINNLIGLDSDAFLNSILFGQRMKRLVEADNKDKRSLFETLFNLEFIKKAKEAAKEKYDELSTSLKSVESEVTSFESRLEDLQREYSDKKRIVEEFEDRKAQRLEKLDEAITTAKTARADFCEQIADCQKWVKDFEKKHGGQEDFDKLLDKMTTKVDKLLKAKNDACSREDKLDDEIAKSNQAIENYLKELNSIHEVCPYCERDMPKSKIASAKKQIQKKVEDEKKVIEQLSKELSTVNKDAEKAVKQYLDANKEQEQLRSDVNKLLTTYREHQQEIKNLQVLTDSKDERISELKHEIAHVKSEEPVDVDLEDMKKRIKQTSDEIDNLQNKVLKDLEKEFERVKWWNQKGFGSGGLKAFVFSSMLAKLNEYVQKYAGRLGLSVRFSVDLSKESKPFTTKCYKGSLEVDYDELSGGEKQRVDITLAFAMHDLVSHTSDLNILIMDEVFEGLDSEGIESAFDLIRVKAGSDKTVFIITHSMTIDSLNSKSVEVTKSQEGISTLQ